MCQQRSLHTERQSRQTEHKHKEEEMNILPHHKWWYKTQTPSPTSKSDRVSDSDNRCSKQQLQQAHQYRRQLTAAHFV